MRAYIITIGDEILVGQIVDTNAAYLAEALTEYGFDVVERSSVADTAAAIRSGLDRAMAQADIVITTGGLGPTKDDVTKAVLADYVGTELAFHEDSWRRLQKIIRGFGREPQESHRQQCYLPATAEILPNDRGTAPGMLFRVGGKYLISLPGVPYEMRHLLRDRVLPLLVAARTGDRIIHQTLLTAGAGESMIAEKVADLEAALPAHLRLAYLPNLGTVRLRLTGRGPDAEVLQAELDQWMGRLRDRLGDLVFGMGTGSLLETVTRLLQARELWVATAESCTGGYVASQLTRLPGSSAHFRGGIVAYDNEVKIDELGVSPAVLEEHGAVSEPVVIQMVRGACRLLRTDVAVATSGIAGPSGGTPEKPVGTIWIAAGNKKKVVTYLLRAGKDRQRNIQFATNAVLNLLRKFVEKEYGRG
jgi:nicotinamide-nucleotide amidase